MTKQKEAASGVGTQATAGNGNDQQPHYSTPGLAWQCLHFLFGGA